MCSESLVVFSGTSNSPLANNICRELGTRLGDMAVFRHPDGEIGVRIDEDVQGKDVFIIQSTSKPVNDNIMELLVMIDAARRSAADRITVVIPYFGYARQDRRDEGDRVPITARLVANLIEAAGADRLVTMELHSTQIQGFFDIPVEHLYAGDIFAEHFRAMEIPNLCVCSPDVGSIKMARGMANKLHAGLATVDKRRISGEVTKIGFVIGDVKDKNVILLDDMISTAGSISEASKVVKEMGARDVYLAAVHGIFCGEALLKVCSSPIKGVYVTDTIEQAFVGRDVIQLSTALVFAHAIERIHMSSVTRLQQKRKGK